MPTDTVINGRPATVAYLDAGWNHVEDAAAAAYVEIHFEDDDSVVIATRESTNEPEASRRSS